MTDHDRISEACAHGLLTHVGLMTAWAEQPRRPCWTCRYHGGSDPSGGIRCTERPPRKSGYWLIVKPADGCAFWEREPGADDETVRNPA